MWTISSSDVHAFILPLQFVVLNLTTEAMACKDIFLSSLRST